ncbi:MAG: serine hydrolase [Halobacteriovoraceae bacterium]|nr:serine hydrolase [Halobacteriovoraceae bacterium]
MKKLIEKLMKNQHFDSIAVGVLDFKKGTSKCFEYSKGQWHSSPYLIYDLASLTKPLTNSLSVISNLDKIKNKKIFGLLNHTMGVPIGGRLSKTTWREQLLGYKLISSPTSYSDYSSLLAQILIEEEIGHSVYSFVEKYSNKEVTHWTELNADQKEKCVITGMRKGKIIQGVVHDDNAYYLQQKISHAGLFSSISSLCDFLIQANKKIKLNQKMKTFFEQKHGRFIYGWDTISSPEETLAGKGCSLETFGHLGFTGTSIWIDCQKDRGSIILSNATKNFWYDRGGLNHLRRAIGEMIWKM